MNKVIGKVSTLYETLKKSIEKFPLTIITILIITLIYVIDLEQNIISEFAFNHILLFGLIFANGTFLTETISKEKNKKTAGYIISAVVALVFTCISVWTNVIEKMLSRSIIDWIEKLLVCGMVSVFSLSVYFNYKKSGKTFEQYVTSVFVNVLKTSIIYGILALGSAIVTAVFIYLILNGSRYTLLARIEILILGLYYIPTLLYSLYNIEEKNSKFSKVVIKYVLGTLVIIAFAIIYMYIIKIIILRNMPSNQIFRILAALFILGCPIWTMIENFKEDTTLDKINNLLPKLFIPFIFLQIYSIGVRILNNGFTESRYLCIMLIIFEIIYTIIKIRKKEIGKVILVFIALTVISIIFPYINMYKVSIRSQYNNLKMFKEKVAYTEEEKQKIYGAYYYLNARDEGKKLINNLLTPSEKNEIINFRKSSVTESNITSQHINAYINEKSLNISGYSNLYIITLSNYRSNQGSIEKVFGNLELITLDNNERIYANISQKIKEYMQYGYTLQDNFENINKIQIDSNKLLILTRISVTYDETNESVEDYSMAGYLLER